MWIIYQGNLLNSDLYHRISKDGNKITLHSISGEHDFMFEYDHEPWASEALQYILRQLNNYRDLSFYFKSSSYTEQAKE